MLSLASKTRERFYLYLLLLATLLFQLRFTFPIWEFEVQSSHIKTVFFITAALLIKDGMSLLGDYDKKQLGLCALFFLLSLLTSINTLDPLTGYGRWYCYFTNFLLAIGLLLGMRAGKMSASGIVFITMIACFILVLAEVRNVVQDWELYRTMNKGILWRSLHFNHIRNFAHVPVAGLLLSTWLVCKPRADWRRSLGILLSVLFMTALLWTGGRAPLMVLPICMLVLIKLLPAVAGRRVLGIWLLSVGIGFGLLHFSGNDSMLQQLLTRFGYDLRDASDLLSPQDTQQSVWDSTESESFGNLGSGRGRHWQRGLHLWLDHPVLGNGGDAFFITNGYTVLHPHNWIIGCLVDYGALGLIFIFVVLVTLLCLSVRVIRADRENSMLLTVAFTLVVAWLVYGTLSGNLYYSWSLSIFAIATAILGEAVGRHRGFALSGKHSKVVGQKEMFPPIDSVRGI